MTIHQKWLPYINKQLCIGCSTCVEHCPTDALKSIDDKAHLVNPNQCIYCLDCEEICPEGAIEIPLFICKSSTK